MATRTTTRTKDDEDNSSSTGIEIYDDDDDDDDSLSISSVEYSFTSRNKPNRTRKSERTKKHGKPLQGIKVRNKQHKRTTTPTESGTTTTTAAAARRRFLLQSRSDRDLLSTGNKSMSAIGGSDHGTRSSLTTPRRSAGETTINNNNIDIDPLASASMLHQSDRLETIKTAMAELAALDNKLEEEEASGTIDAKTCGWTWNITNAKESSSGILDARASLKQSKSRSTLTRPGVRRSKSTEDELLTLVNSSSHRNRRRPDNLGSPTSSSLSRKWSAENLASRRFGSKNSLSSSSSSLQCPRRQLSASSGADDGDLLAAAARVAGDRHRRRRRSSDRFSNSNSNESMAVTDTNPPSLLQQRFHKDFPKETMVPSEEVLKSMYAMKEKMTPVQKQRKSVPTATMTNVAITNDSESHNHKQQRPIGTKNNTTTTTKLVVKPQRISRQELQQMNNEYKNFDDSHSESGLSFASEFEWKSWKNSVKTLGVEAAREEYQKSQQSLKQLSSKILEEDDDNYNESSSDRKKKPNPNLEVLSIGKDKGGRKDRSVASKNRSSTARRRGSSKNPKGLPHRRRRDDEGVRPRTRTRSVSRSKSDSARSQSVGHRRSASRDGGTSPVRNNRDRKIRHGTKKDELRSSMHGTTSNTKNNLSAEERLAIIRGDTSVGSSKASKERMVARSRDMLSQSSHGTFGSASKVDKNQALRITADKNKYKTKSKASREGKPLSSSQRDSSNKSFSDNFEDFSEDNTDPLHNSSNSIHDSTGSFDESSRAHHSSTKKERRKKKKIASRSKSTDHTGEKGSNGSVEQSSTSEFDGRLGDSTHNGSKNPVSQSTFDSGGVSQKSGESATSKKKKMKKARRTTHGQPTSEHGQEDEQAEFDLGFEKPSTSEMLSPCVPKFGGKAIAAGKSEPVQKEVDFFELAHTSWIGESKETLKEMFIPKAKEKSSSHHGSATDNATNNANAEQNFYDQAHASWIGDAADETPLQAKKRISSSKTKEVSSNVEIPKRNDAKSKSRRRSKTPTPTTEIIPPGHEDKNKESVAKRRGSRSSTKPKSLEETPHTPKPEKTPVKEEESAGFELELYDTEDISPLTVASRPAFSTTRLRPERFSRMGMESQGDLRIEELT